MPSEMLEPWQQRVMVEKHDLIKKLLALDLFFGTTTYAALPEDEKRRLIRQKSVMEQYEQVLSERIAAFGD